MRGQHSKINNNLYAIKEQSESRMKNTPPFTWIPKLGTSYTSKKYAQIYILKTTKHWLEKSNKRHPVFIDWTTHHSKEANASQIYL